MYLITTSRPYTNANPHIGTAIDAIYADTFNRFFGRLYDGNTYFTMGTDEHSFKIADKAVELGISPKSFVDQKYSEFKDFYASLEIISDQFVQTSTEKHHWISNLVWEKLKSKGLIYKKIYKGLYCKGCEDFYSPSQLINNRCPVHTNLEIQEVDEENYFFKLSAFKTRIFEYLDEVKVPDKSVVVEMKNFVEKLEDISFSRDRKRLSVDWGVPVWTDDSQVMYVWFEALLSYLTPIVDDELFDEWKDKDSDQKKEVEGRVWSELKNRMPQDLQVIGRDNSKFHLIIYPAILFGLELPPIKSIVIHGMITDSLGRKFAKSLGNGFEIHEFVEKFGTEGVRYFVLHDCNSVGDTSFDWERARESYNANLADNLGNLVVRISNLVEKNLNGFVDVDNYEITGLIDLDLVYQNLMNLAPEKAFQALFAQSTKINQYLEETKPWELAKNKDKNEKKISEILNRSAKAMLEISRTLALFLPKTGAQIYEIFSEDRIIKSPILFPKVEPIEPKLDSVK